MDGECGERFKRVLIHVVNNAELDEQEIEHSSLSGNSSVDFSQLINLDLSFLCDGLLLLNLCGSLLGDLKGLNKSSVLEDGSGIGVG